MTETSPDMRNLETVECDNVLTPEEYSKRLCSNDNENVNDTEDFEFSVPDNTEETNDEDLSKYTLVDNLDEDEPISGQSYVLISFVSPESLMNCNIRGVKIRGVAPTEQKAKQMADELKKKDKYFDIFIGEVGKWLPWNPDPLTVKEAEYRNKKQTEIMKNIHKNNSDKLNELVGRYKENLNESKKQHKKRIVNTVKENVNNVEENVTEETETTKQEQTEEKQYTNQRKPKPSMGKKNRDGSAIRTKLQKILDAKRAKQEQEKEQREVLDTRTKDNDLDEKKQKLTVEKERLKADSDNLKSLNEKSEKLSQNLNKMKEMLKNLEEQKKLNN